VIAGQAVVTRDDQELIVNVGQAVDLPPGVWHRVRNPGTVDLEFIEVQTGEYFGEDDIERSQDDYGRGTS
jgi:mannose-6-phosphate isomerase-like protein (cupin superfamily)